LSELLQRGIKEKRKREISDYLYKTEERFFNSLVLAVYGENPEWLPASVSSKMFSEIENFEGEVGVLKFSGKEKIIPIDGQHRLAGIKDLFERYEKNLIEPDDEYSFLDDNIPVIFVAHRTDSEKDRLRTRRLFTTLNKYAVKVNRYEVISLDEDDPMAITTRWLVENDRRFEEGRIKFKGGANISIGDSALTTIENIYDILTILFTSVFEKVSIKSLTNGSRPTKEKLQHYRKQALLYFDNLERNYSEIKRYYSESDYQKVAIKFRKKGSILFRPVGLKLMTNLISKFEFQNIEGRFEKIKNIPMNLNELPYYGLLITEDGRMQDGNEAKVRQFI
jgi:DNA sulfur modification protein DndB